MSDNWPRENVDFYKINCSKEQRIKICSKEDLKEEYYLYSKNFREAAHILAEDALKSNRISTLDVNFFGLAFLYRHSIELILKAIGFKYIKGLEERKKFLSDTFHNLFEILNYIKKYIIEYIKYDEDSYNWIIQIFKDMNCIDKESDSFRYPFRIIKRNFCGWNKGTYEISEFISKQKHIDLFKFANKMEIIFEILENYLSNKKTIDTNHKKYSSMFLEEGGYYYYQSVIGKSYNSEKFNINVSSYENCAKVIYKIMSTNPEKKNLFMPLCYLYRNCVELSIKQIFFQESSYDYQKKLELLNNKKHKILSLWNLIKKDIVKHAGRKENDEIIINAESYIRILSNLDGKADKFRYPTDKYLNLYFKKTRYFDLENIKDFFEDIITFLSCVWGMMAQNNEYLREMKYEY